MKELSLQAKSPDPSKIPDEDLVGVTVVLLTCSFKDREFVRVGYYVNNEYTEEEMRENPPARPVIEKVQRTEFINLFTVNLLSVGKKLLLLIPFLLMINVCDIVYICTGSSMRMISKPQYSLMLESLLTQEHSV